MELLRETVEEDKIAKPLDSANLDACFLTNRSHGLLEYAVSTCPKGNRDRNTFTRIVTRPAETFDAP